MKKLFIAFLSVICLCNFSMNAQIGYQVSLLNTATGEPRANERVTLNVTITNCDGTTICSQTTTETSNDFGIISVAIGNASTFSKTDWSKMPFFISATVDGILIGKSQLLSVPVAECAKGLISCQKFINGRSFKGKMFDEEYEGSITFQNNIATVKANHPTYPLIKDFKNYVCYGNIIIGGFGTLLYDIETDKVYGKISNGDIIIFE